MRPVDQAVSVGGRRRWSRWDRFMDAVAFKPVDRPPHFEQTFELSEEAFGIPLPPEDIVAAARGDERRRLFEALADRYSRIVERFRWDALLVWNPVSDHELLYEFLPFLRDYLHDRLGERVPVGSFVWGAVHCIDTVKDYLRFAVELYDDPLELHRQAEMMLSAARLHARRLAEAGSDIIDVGSDMAYNGGPFVSPVHFAEFVAPYLQRIVAEVKGLGCTCILHSDGNLMPVLDQIIEARPHVLQSIDPMAGMDIRLVKQLTAGRVALMGNVSCGLLQCGTRDQVRASAAYCLEHGAPGGGYLYSSSNTIFRGIPLENYESMLDCYHGAFGAGPGDTKEASP